MKLLTDDSKRPVLFKRARFVGFLALGFAASMVFITLVGAILAFSAVPLAAVFVALVPMKNTFLIWGCSAVYSVLIWATLYFAGRLYMKATSLLGFKYRSETLTPIFIVSLVCWIPLMAIYGLAQNFNLGTAIVGLGLLLSLVGQRQEMVALRKKLSNKNASPLQVESAKKISNTELADRLYEFKTAESIEHLEQLSKNCLLLINPAAAAQPDCTSTLINELMKRKLNAEADEISLLQLNLGDT